MHFLKENMQWNQGASQYNETEYIIIHEKNA